MIIKKAKTLSEINSDLYNHKITIVKFGTTHCGACKVTENNIKSALKDCDDNVAFVVVDCEDCDDAVLDEFCVQNIPLTIVCQTTMDEWFEKTINTVFKKNGIVQKDEILKFLSI